MRLEEELRCEGLLGFGAGYVLGRANTPMTQVQTLPPSENYCASKCSVSAACLARHRTKCKLMFPNATKSFDAMVEKRGQLRATREWAGMHPQTPEEPYMLQMIADLQDGFEFAKTGRVRNRGRFTLDESQLGRVQVRG